MKFHLSWGLLALLAGCQLTQPTDTSITETIPTNQEPVAPSTSSEETSLNAESPVSTDHTDSAIVLTPQQQDDLWQRITMQFTLDIPHNEKVDYYREWFIKHPQHLETVAQRAEPFLYLIVDKIEQRQFPLELALLPIVESAFDTKAYSSGRAAGLWQFLSGTATRYGLEQDFWYDGRRDVYASTDAALNYLAYLSTRFSGNWYHAIAAYNSGGGRVSSAIRKNIRHNKPTDFFSLSLPRETSSYVPKLLALADVMANRDKYGIKLPVIANKPYLELVVPNEQLDLRTAANYAGLDYQQLLSYNPGYNHWATSPTGAQQLLIPKTQVSRFHKMLEENRGNGIKYARYTVKRGDSVSVIAHRYNIPTTTLKKTNNLRNNFIRIGQSLLVPVKRSAAESRQQIAALESPSATPNRITQRTHTVKSGDTLWRIAQQYKESYQTIAKWNNLSLKQPLKIGQRLIVKQLDEALVSSNLVSYQVKPGDTLSEIAEQFNVSSDDIIKWNHLPRTHLIKVGQTLHLYLSEGDTEERV